MLRLITLLILLSSLSFSQSKWKRKAPTKVKFTLFKSSQAFNLETAEVVPKGDLFYGISHRFNSPISTGFEDLYGMDGGASMRTKLGYGITDDLMATLGRSNINAQFDLNVKYKIWKSKDALYFPVIISANLGGAYTTKNVLDEVDDARRFQFFGSVIINTMLFEKLGIGISPTFLQNALINSVDPQNSVTLGWYLQFYFNDMASFIVEANPTISGFRGDGNVEYFDTYSFGFEFETGGHFFKLLASNNNAINMAQVNLGSVNELTLNNLRFGFQITRYFGILN